MDMNEDSLNKLIKSIKLNTVRTVTLTGGIELSQERLRALADALKVNTTVFSINFEKNEVLLSNEKC
jgi:organic radical activating enzyme